MIDAFCNFKNNLLSKAHLNIFILGQPIDAYSQPPPGPWEIPAKTPSFFRDEKQVIKVPYTSSVKVFVNRIGLTYFDICNHYVRYTIICVVCCAYLITYHSINRTVMPALEWEELHAHIVQVLEV